MCLSSLVPGAAVALCPVHLSFSWRRMCAVSQHARSLDSGRPHPFVPASTLGAHEIGSRADALSVSWWTVVLLAPSFLGRLFGQLSELRGPCHAVPHKPTWPRWISSPCLKETPLASPVDDGLKIFSLSDWWGRLALDAVALCELLGESMGSSSTSTSLVMEHVFVVIGREVHDV